MEKAYLKKDFVMSKIDKSGFKKHWIANRVGYKMPYFSQMINGHMLMPMRDIVALGTLINAVPAEMIDKKKTKVTA